MFLLNLTDLKIGDIVLIRSDSPVSEAIRRLSACDFSHAILYAGGSSCLESDGYGVQARNSQRMLFENEDDVKVLRLREPDDEKMHEIIFFARQAVGTEYSMNEAKYALQKQKQHALEPNRQYCSRFVAQAYKKGMINLVENSDYCLPDDLLKSEVLQEVRQILPKGTEREIEMAKSENPVGIQTTIHNKIFANARLISGRDIQTFEQLSQYIIQHPQTDAEFALMLRESGYLTMWKIDKKNNPWQYDVIKFLSYHPTIEDSIETASFLVNTENEMRVRFYMTLEYHILAYLFSGGKYFFQKIKLYQKLLRLSFEREKIALSIINLKLTPINLD